MANPISGVKFPSTTPLQSRLDDKKTSASPGQPLASDRDSDHPVQLKSPGAERLERPLSQRIGSLAQALAGVERLRDQLEDAPETGVTAHRLGETEVEALLSRAPAT